jgi:hypothetical protein
MEAGLALPRDQAFTLLPLAKATKIVEIGTSSRQILRQCETCAISEMTPDGGGAREPKKRDSRIAHREKHS